MFWWMHFTKADVNDFTERPLILWLQGGPGSSSTGYGNFEILGPIDLAQQERNFTWINTHNVRLYVIFHPSIIFFPSKKNFRSCLLIIQLVRALVM